MDASQQHDCVATRVPLTDNPKEDGDFAPLATLLFGLTKWDESSFPIAVPPSSFTGNQPVVKLDDLFKKPGRDEVRELAIDGHGNRKKLSADQKSDIRQTGTFQVPSTNVVGQNHVWRLSSWLQKGTAKTNSEFMDDLATSTERFIIKIPRRLIDSGYLNVWDGVKNMMTSLIDLPVLFIGWRTMKLRVDPVEAQKKLEKFSLEMLMNRIMGQTGVPEPENYVFDLGNFTLRLPTLNADGSGLRLARERYREFEREWDRCCFERRKSLATEFSDEENVQQLVADREQVLFQERVYDLIRGAMPTEEANCVIDLLETVRLIKLAYKDRRERFEKDVADYETKLRTNYPIRGRIESWVTSMKKAYVTDWEKINLESHLVSDVVAQLSQTSQSRYVLEMKRQIASSSDVARKTAELKEEVPAREYNWKFRIWSPSGWKIKQDDVGLYHTKKEYTVSTSSAWPFWRLVTNPVMRFAVGTYNCLWWGTWNLWSGPIGLRSLWGSESYPAWTDVDEHTGQMTVQKLASWYGRLNILWNHVTEARKKFEDTPDTGFLGKDFARVINKFWNIVVKKWCGTVLIGVGHPIMVILNTIFSTIIVVGSPFFGLCWPVIHYLFDLLIYDTDAPSSNNPKWFPILNILIKKFACKGAIQMCLALVAVGWNMLAGTTGVAWNALMTTGRYVWDFFAYHLIIKRKGRIPAEEHPSIFGLNVAKRISGPGLATNYYYQITSDLALLMLKYGLERNEVEAYSKMVKTLIGKPYEELEKMNAELGKIGLKMDHNTNPYREISENRDRLMRKMDDAVSEHWSHVPIRGSIHGQVRMTRAELNNTLEKAVPFVEKFFSERVFCYMTAEQVASFWRGHGLNPNSWDTLTNYYLRSSVHDNIMVPLEQADLDGFCLKVEDVDLRSYINDIYRGAPHDEIAVETPSYPWSSPESFPTGTGITVTLSDLECKDALPFTITAEQIYDEINRRKDLARKEEAKKAHLEENQRIRQQKLDAVKKNDGGVNTDPADLEKGTDDPTAYLLTEQDTLYSSY